MAINWKAAIDNIQSIVGYGSLANRDMAMASEQETMTAQEKAMADLEKATKEEELKKKAQMEEAKKAVNEKLRLLDKEINMVQKIIKTDQVSPVTFSDSAERLRALMDQRDSVFEEGRALIGLSPKEDQTQVATPNTPPTPSPTPIPSTPKNLAPYYEKAASDTGIPVNLLTAQAHQESMGFNPDVMSGKRKSSAGATGVQQFMPGTVEELKRLGYQDFDPNIPEQAIPAGAYYMKTIMDRTTGGDPFMALRAYNAGEGNYRKYNGEIPFAETIEYERRIRELMGL